MAMHRAVDSLGAPGTPKTFVRHPPPVRATEEVACPQLEMFAPNEPSAPEAKAHREAAERT
eukprot:1224765-Pyramimonas_sp.AAC.1